MSRADMLRETCPSDLEPIDSPTTTRAPSALLLFGPPLLLCTGVVLLAWLHAWLGMPLGAEWAAKLWSMAEMAIVPTIAATAFGAWARRQNEDNLRRLLHTTAITLEDPGESAAARPRVRQTGPHRTLPSGRHQAIEAEVVDEDEEDGPW